MAQYFLLTYLNGNPINNAVLSFIGKPSEITGIVEKMEDCYLLKISVDDISVINETLNIY